ncbi:MAG TPA: A/G-specific adenine glycosylase [Gammaproteobacteria bacterium]|nr:A/G-specific adenine glycosylase [Gammaproteobacteria bacterium]
MNVVVDDFDGRVLAWFDVHGRKSLPWQQNPTPYRVWISEIMLQQTQVNTVIPYYERFMRSFPSVSDLAGADEDHVLAHWSGLGYYARARNLHKAAKSIVNDFAGELPLTSEALQSLPGIGRSTAGAILSLASQQHEAILDGNVKRVLARCFGIGGWPGKTDVLKQLWAVSESLTPKGRTHHYNQAMMDLGATLCRRSRPDCDHCPLANICVAHAEGVPENYPGKKLRRTIPVKSTVMLLATDKQDRVWLYKRPPDGIWGGLWSLPEVDSEHQLDAWCQLRALERTAEPEVHARFRHTFSHFHLEINVLRLPVKTPPKAAVAEEQGVWYKCGSDIGGMAAPVAKILDSFWSFN